MFDEYLNVEVLRPIGEEMKQARVVVDRSYLPVNRCHSVTDLLHLMATSTHDTSIGTRGSGEDMIPFNFIVPLPLTPH